MRNFAKTLPASDGGFMDIISTIDGTVPLGGVGQSGNGHDKSLHALDKYINLKTAWIKL